VYRGVMLVKNILSIITQSTSQSVSMQQ